MFIGFVEALRAAGIPAGLQQHLLLLQALAAEVIDRTPEQFYYLSRSIFVKDEGHIDRFDRVFAQVFRGIADDADTSVPIPEEWLRAVAERYLTPDEMAKVESVGSWTRSWRR